MPAGRLHFALLSLGFLLALLPAVPQDYLLAAFQGISAECETCSFEWFWNYFLIAGFSGAVIFTFALLDLLLSGALMAFAGKFCRSRGNFATVSLIFIAAVFAGNAILS